MDIQNFCYDCDEVESVDVPAFSPLSESDLAIGETDSDDIESVEAPPFSPLSEEEYEELGMYAINLIIDVKTC